MTTSVCKAKNPATCPYHSSRAYQTAVNDLAAAQKSIQTATNLTEFEEASYDIADAIKAIDATERGFQTLHASHAKAKESGDFATEAQLGLRLRYAQKIRDEEAADDYGTMVTGIREILTQPTTLRSSDEALDVGTYYDESNEANTCENPASLTQVRAMLKNSRGVPNGGVRQVVLNSSNLQAGGKYNGGAEFVEVYAPKDGRPLIVDMTSGFTKIIVKQGNVIFLAGSKAGNVIHVEENAQAVVLPYRDTKVSAYSKLGGKITVIPNSEARGTVSGEGDKVIAPSVYENHLRISKTK